MPNRAHLITGGYPVGSTAGHDMDYARLELLRKLYARGYQTTVANDFVDIGSRLGGVDFLVTYVAGPYPDDEQSQVLDGWLSGGGKWFALHGTSGGRAKRVDGMRRRKMVRLAHHDVLGRVFPESSARSVVRGQGHGAWSSASGRAAGLLRGHRRVVPGGTGGR